MLSIMIFGAILGINKVNADSISIAEQQGLGAFSITIGGENYDGDNYFTVGANTERTIQVKMYNWEGLTRPWTYLMTSGCVANGYAGWSYLTNTSHTDHWFDETQFVAFTADTERECYTPAGRQGRIFYMQFRVGVYDDMDGTGEELQVGSYLHLVNNTNYSVQFHFYNWYLSSDDILTKIKNDANLLNAYNRQVTAINEQTNAINNQTTAIVGAVSSVSTKIINEDTTYNNNPSETIDGKDDMDDLTDAESGLINNLDFSGAEDIDITINAESSAFIWQIVNQLRQMNGAIVLLMTSILGLGIIKMILNR